MNRRYTFPGPGARTECSHQKRCLEVLYRSFQVGVFQRRADWFSPWTATTYTSHELRGGRRQDYARRMESFSVQGRSLDPCTVHDAPSSGLCGNALCLLFSRDIGKGLGTILVRPLFSYLARHRRSMHKRVLLVLDCLIVSGFGRDRRLRCEVVAVVSSGNHASPFPLGIGAFEGQVFVIVVLLRLLVSSSLDMHPHHMTGEETPVLVHVHSLLHGRVVCG